MTTPNQKGQFKPTGWEQVKRTAASVKDEIEQQKLLQYVLTHCSANQIEDVLEEIESIRQNRQKSMFDSNEEKTDDLELTDLVKYERKDQQKLLTDLMDKITEDLNVPLNFSLATICHGLLDNYDLSKVGLKNFEI